MNIWISINEDMQAGKADFTFREIIEGFLSENFFTKTIFQSPCISMLSLLFAFFHIKSPERSSFVSSCKNLMIGGVDVRRKDWIIYT